MAVGNAKPMIRSHFAIRVTFEDGAPESCLWTTTICGWTRTKNSRRPVCLRARWLLPRHFNSAGNPAKCGKARCRIIALASRLTWRDHSASGPVIDRLPSALWLIGLGNLGSLPLDTGNAALCGTGGSPGGPPSHDFLADSNNSTSLLTYPEVIWMRRHEPWRAGSISWASDSNS